MTVYFVYRSHYDNPSTKCLKRFDDASVLDWFKNRWAHLAHADEARARLKRLLGCSVYGFATVFERAAEHSLPPPATDRQLNQYLQQHLYSEGSILYQPHLLSVQTDDDELELAYYFFDDHYLARHGKRAAFLLNESWELPAGTAEQAARPSEPTTELKPAGRAEGATYMAFLAWYDSGNLTDIEGGYRIKGVRLPELCHYLALVKSQESWPFEVRLLRSQLFAETGKRGSPEEGFLQEIRANPADDLPWLAYSDWLLEHGRKPARSVLLEQALAGAARCPVGNVCNMLDVSDFGLGSIPEAREELKALMQQVHRPNKSKAKPLVRAEEHVAQVSLQPGEWHHWILFDDLWAGAHRDLANAILRYARTWDVLSPGRPED
jgi:uncharacterized protein (TIGR02996 family)